MPLNELIIVVDDPISSFDSNHLFNSYSFLKAECESAKQLIILTHNFGYFRLVRDWILNKNKRDKPIKSRIYSIETTIDNGRQSRIKNANQTLMSFNSEYHYIFFKLNAFKETTELSLGEAFLVANLSRKLLESFLNFKFPKGRNDFSQLLAEAIKEDTHKREKIYRFINKYSHNAIIDVNDNSVDNLLGESSNIVTEVLGVVNNLDPIHFKEMESLLG
ncbi:AAA domain-containing protein [Pontibacter mucosus]|uniref:AAA domain-containing protein n=1 Tax=Pontibacter mucosus TaxID=1649266 RepID=A0A2T5YQG3_9BACT|nr:AAA domain-containing protein [Pontibacter mucosus]